MDSNLSFQYFPNSKFHFEEEAVFIDTKLDDDSSFQLHPKKSRFQRIFFVPSDSTSSDDLFMKNPDSFPSSQKSSNELELTSDIGRCC